MCVPLAKDFRGKDSKQYQLNVVEFHQGKNLCYKFLHNYNGKKEFHISMLVLNISILSIADGRSHRLQCHIFGMHCSTDFRIISGRNLNFIKTLI